WIGGRGVGRSTRPDPTPAPKDRQVRCGPRESTMPVHDWTCVEAGIFHAFHTVWVAGIQSALNEGVLPDGYYALAGHHTGAGIADARTLPAPPALSQRPSPPAPTTGGTAVAEAPPKCAAVRRWRSPDYRPAAAR